MSAAEGDERSAWGQPGPQFVGSWEAAELNAAMWMRHWGYADATARPGGPDRGIDVRATGALAQVKNRPSQVGRPDIQRLLGAAIDHPDAKLFFFAAGGFSAAAIEEADRRDIALFTFVLDGTMSAVNESARRASRSPVRALSTAPPESTPVVTGKGSFLAEKWRVIAGILCLIAPFAYLGDPDIYTGPFILDALKFVGMLIGLWLVGLCLIGWHVTDQQPPPERVGDPDRS